MGKHQTNSVYELTSAYFEASNQLVKCDTKNGKFMACCMLYRGDVQPRSCNEAVKRVREGNKHVQFVDWAPAGFKIGINNKPSVESLDSEGGTANKSLTMV